MKIGYIRVSTQEQNYEMQFDALKKAGVEKVFYEKVSGKRKDRKEFLKMIEAARTHDEVIAYSISRFGRTNLQLIQLLNDFREKKIVLKTIREGIDTSTKFGRLWFQMAAIFAENEREQIVEDTINGLKAARARGRVGGRPKGLNPKAQKTAQMAATLYNEGRQSIAEIMQGLGIKSRATLYSYLRHENVKINGFKILKANNKK